MSPHSALCVGIARLPYKTIKSPVVPSEGTAPEKGEIKIVAAVATGCPSERYKHCNHHHELTDDHILVDFGTGEFVANKAAVPLLKALNEAGIRTRTHHWTGDGYGFIGLLMDNISVEVRAVNERSADQDRYNGKMELLISWESSRGQERADTASPQ